MLRFPPSLIVAVQICRAVIGRDQHVDIAVVIEVAEGGPAPDLGLAKLRAHLAGDVMKAAATRDSETDAEAARILHSPRIVRERVVDVAVDHQQSSIPSRSASKKKQPKPRLLRDQRPISDCSA